MVDFSPGAALWRDPGVCMDTECPVCWLLGELSYITPPEQAVKAQSLMHYPRQRSTKSMELINYT